MQFRLRVFLALFLVFSCASQFAWATKRLNPLPIHFPAFSNALENTVEEIDFGPYGEVGHASTIGRRPSMEDRIVVSWYEKDRNPLLSKGIDRVGIAAIFDGHAGAGVAEAAQEIVPSTILSFLDKLSEQELRSDKELKETLKNAFSSLEDDLNSSCQPKSQETIQGQLASSYYSWWSGWSYQNSGSTALVAVFLNDTLYLVSLGDSRATLISREGKVLARTTDQTPENSEDEIRKRGGTIAWTSGCARIDGLALAGAIGDFGTHLIRRPEVMSINLSNPSLDAQTLVLTCDGVTESLDEEKVVQTVVQERLSKGPARVAESLANRAFREESFDNISVLIIPLQKRASE